jgi:hypothetical protein
MIDFKGERTMSRSIILFAVFAAVAGCASVRLLGPGNTARGQSVTTGDASAVSVVHDDFDDNKRGALWKTYGETDQTKVLEMNKRLEFVTSSEVDNASVGYISDKWWIDPSQDFQMRLDLYFDRVSSGDGWVNLGLTPEPNGPRDNYMRLGIGFAQYLQNYWWEWKDDIGIRTSFTGRVSHRVTLYVYYDSSYDILYVGDAGYDPEQAWRVVPDHIGGRWKHAPLYVFLGATTRRMELGGGNAYVDNFAIDKGKIVSAKPPHPSDPTDPGQPGNNGSHVSATVWIMPSVIRQTDSGDIKVVVSLPRNIRFADWNHLDIPVIAPGNIPVQNPQAAVWPGGTVIIVGTFSRARLLEAVPSKGPAVLRVTGRLKDGRLYDGAGTVTIQ